MTQLQLSPSIASLRIQKSYRGHRSRIQTKTLWKKLYERRKIIQQLVLTEQKYIHDLSIIISDFQMFLFNSKIITPTQVYILFSNIDAIRKLNEHFFVVLHNGFHSYWHYKVLFEQVKKQISFFKIYFQYLNNFTGSMAMMKELKENNARFKQFLLQIRRKNLYNNLDLQDYLIKPVQRLPKYVLLLKLLLKKTAADHPDYENIKNVLEGFEQVNSSNNDKLNKLINNFKLTELEKQAKLPFHIAQPGTEFIMEQNVTVLTPCSKVQDAVLYLLNNRIILTKRTKHQQKFMETVSFRYGASIMENEDQEMYGNCFTLQSIDGDSVTFLCQGEEEMVQIIHKIQEQIRMVEKKTYEKYSALQNLNQASDSFIKKVIRFDLMPEILVLGTEQRTDKMLKYTTYIIQVKVKNVRQKIFLRYSELLQVQDMIAVEFPLLEIKQSLCKTTWLLNHKPKTIEERKMNIQRFLTEVLSKPDVMQAGCRVLSKLGLPEDLYSLPDKLKTNDSFIKKSAIGFNNNNGKHLKSDVQTMDREGMTANSAFRKTRKTYRLSIFEDLSQDEDKSPRKHSLNQNLSASTHKRKLNIEQMLFANELNLGHYIRYSENIQCMTKNKLRIEIEIPWIQNSKGMVRKTIEIMENQRVAVLVNKLVKEIGLNYYKDFRLFMEKEYSQRVLDDDEIMAKVEREVVTGKFSLVFRKMIFIDKEAEENEIKNDRLRLKLIASQLVYDVKKSKYRLNYNSFLTLSVLIAIIQHESKMASEEILQQQFAKENDFNRLTTTVKKRKSESKMRATFQKPTATTTTEPDYKSLAITTRQLLANPYASFFQNDKVWVKDFTDTYKNLHMKLKKIARGNSMLMRSVIHCEEQEQIWTNIVQLSYIGIIDELKSNDLFGSMGYVVQISEQFREVLIDQLQAKQLTMQSEVDAQTRENRNIWLIVKCNCILLYSINLCVKLYEISYEDIDRVLCYPSSIIILFNDLLSSRIEAGDDQRQGRSDEKETKGKSSAKNSRYSQHAKQQKITMVQCRNEQLLPSSLKLKTTNSYTIRELINYYKNFNNLRTKIKLNEDYSNSIMEMIYENEKVLQTPQLSQYDEEQLA